MNFGCIVDVLFYIRFLSNLHVFVYGFHRKTGSLLLLCSLSMKNGFAFWSTDRFGLFPSVLSSCARSLSPAAGLNFWLRVLVWCIFATTAIVVVVIVIQYQLVLDINEGWFYCYCYSLLLHNSNISFFLSGFFIVQLCRRTSIISVFFFWVSAKFKRAILLLLCFLITLVGFLSYSWIYDKLALLYFLCTISTMYFFRPH